MHDQEWTNREERGVEDRTSNISPTMIAWAVAAVLAIVFILQNPTKVEVQFLGMSGTIPLGMALFIAAVGGGGWS